MAFTGDMVHCSAPASIRKVTDLVENTGIPYISVAGNHEWWHFQDLPNLPGEDALRATRDRDALRAAWWEADRSHGRQLPCEDALRATRDRDALRAAWWEADRSHGRQLPYYSTEVGGVRFVAVDDGNYQVNAEQLDFVTDELASGQPVVLMMHIPLTQIHRRDDYAAAERAIGAREGDGPGTIWGRGGPVSVFSCRGETL